MGAISHYAWLTAISMALAGVQFLYSIQFAAGSAMFNKELCVPLELATIIFALAGPLSGFIVQPIVGAFSDNHSGRFGRRRPFIIAGTVISIIGLLGIAFSEMLGEAFGDRKPSDCDLKEKGHTAGIVIGIVSLCLMNVGVNVVMGPSRAIINDLVTSDELVTGNSIATAVMAVSAIVADVVGGVLNDGNGDNYFQKNPVMILFCIGSAFMAITSGITVFFAKEAKHELKEGETAKGVLETFKDIYRGFRYMKLSLFFVAFLYFLSWVAYTPLMINQVVYFVNNVYGINTSIPHGNVTNVMFSTGASIGGSTLPGVGSVYDAAYTFILDPSSPVAPFASPAPSIAPAPVPSPVMPLNQDPAYLATRKGTAMGFYSLALFAGVQFLYSFIAPSVVKILGLKWAYIVPQALATVAYILAPFMAKSGYPGQHWPVPVIMLIFSLTGPNFLAFNSVPFALVSAITQGENGGLYMGVLNSASVIAQTVINLIVGAILAKTPKLQFVPNPTDPKFPPNVGYGIAFGGIFSALAIVWCFFLIRNDLINKADPDTTPDEKKPLIQASDAEATL